MSEGFVVDDDAPVNPVSELDDVIHQRTRLGLLVVLSEVKQADFTYLKKALSLTDGNLGRHLDVLATHELVKIDKGYRGRRPRTVVTITAAGEAGLTAEMRTLNVLVQRSRARGVASFDSTASTGLGELSL